MSIERALQSLRREFLLDLSMGFVYDMLRDRAAQLDMAEHRRMVLRAVQRHPLRRRAAPGPLHLLLATDPIRDLPVAFALVGANDHDHMRRFLGNLKDWGLEPATVITDGSNLYPALLAELWPDADHQLCVFHILKEINGLVLAAVRRLRKGMARRGRAGRKRKPGSKGAKRRARSPAGDDEEGGGGVRLPAPAPDRQAAGELHEPGDREDLGRMLSYLPELAVLRDFADRIAWLFDTPKDYHQASCRRSVIVRDTRVPGRARTGQGAGAIGPGEVPQDHGLPEQPGEPAGADQQSRGADQPDDPVPGEGAVQVAAAEDAGPVRGPAAGPHLEPLDSGRGRGGEIRRDPPAAGSASSSQATTSSSRVRMWWCSARSVEESFPVSDGPHYHIDRARSSDIWAQGR